MTCTDFRKYLYAFADGELATKDNLEALEHLNMCPDCSRKVTVQQGLRKAVAGLYRDEVAPSGLRDRVRVRLAREAARSPWRSVFRVFVPLAVAAVLAMLVLPRGASDVGTNAAASDDARLAQLVAKRHVMCCADRDHHHNANLPHQRSALRKQLTERYGFPVIAPKLTGYTLQSANLCGIEGHPGSHLLYETDDGERLVSVFSVRPALLLAGRGQPRNGRTYHLLKSDTHSVVTWNEEGTSHVACAEGDPETLLALVAPSHVARRSSMDGLLLASHTRPAP